MTLTIEQTEPDFVVVSYDITKSSKRDHARMMLLEHGFVMDTESVYYGLYSAGLMEELERMQSNEKGEKGKVGVRFKVRTPAYPTDQALRDKQAYEEKFGQQYEELQEKVDRVDQIFGLGEIPQKEEQRKALVEEGLLHIDRDTGKIELYNGNQILAMVRSNEYYLRRLELALNRRRQRDNNPKLKKMFDELSLRVREISSHIYLQEKSAKKQIEREDMVSASKGNTNL